MNTKLLMPLALSALLSPALARAHCDTLDGPVVVAAREALESGKLNPVLAWVPADGEGEIREAFVKARAARKAGKEAREVADRWFFETLVRVHRMSEGAPYTGLKPAGAVVEPAVAVVDQAIAKRDPKPIDVFLRDAVHGGLHSRWDRLAAEKPPADDVAAGRRWVAAYVPFVHWVEAVHAAAAGPDTHGGAAPAEAASAADHAHGKTAPRHDGAPRHDH